MKVIKIPKKNGKDFRTVYVQNSGWERKKYRSLALILEDFFLTKKNNRVVHGFMPKRNCMTNAMEHIGKKYTLTIDLKSFFDYVGVNKLTTAGLSVNLAYEVMYKERARQGLSSSPMAANIAASLLDDDILKHIEGKECVYTRYADDLTFSCNDIEYLKQLRYDINGLVKKHKFKVNHKKTRIQSASYGKRVITGIAVDENGCSATRANKRKLRSLKFNYEKETNPKKKEYFRKMMVGLEEFNKCKLPNDKPKERKLRLQLWHNHLEYASDRILEPSFLNRRYFTPLNRRRDLVHKVGIERSINFLKTNIIDTYGNYELLSVQLEKYTNRRMPRKYLKMQNPSVPGMFHIEGVHPNCKTVQEAINYRRYGDLNNSHAPWLPIVLT